MDMTTHRSLDDLFDQLGLPSSPADIRRFIREHGPLPPTQALTDAPMWTDAQRGFLIEALRADDGDWTMAVDELNVLLHGHPEVEDLPAAHTH